MRVNEVITESVYDWWANRQQQKTARAAMQPGYVGPETAAFNQQMNPIFQRQQQQAAAQKATDDAAKATSTAGSGPESDISKTVEPGMQYRFQNPENPGGFIIVRQTGYYLDQLPRALQGQVKRDKATGLYPVLRPANIKKINQYYDQASDAGSVVEEPAAAL